jgi:hypothetical protein
MSDTGQGKGRGAGTGLRCVSIAAPSCRVTVIKRAHSPGRAHLGRLLRDSARVAHAIEADRDVRISGNSQPVDREGKRLVGVAGFEPATPTSRT